VRHSILEWNCDSHEGGGERDHEGEKNGRESNPSFEFN
jgi:hypothetical protein